MKTQSALIVSVAAMLLIAVATGCQTSKAYNSNGVPSNKYIIGGGYQIDFTAPCKGVAYAVEAKSQKVLQLKSLDKGERFNFEVDAQNEDFEKTLGIKRSDARFAFYFVPIEEAVPSLKTVGKEE
jgi:hypothetical protein